MSLIIFRASFSPHTSETQKSKRWIERFNMPLQSQKKKIEKKQKLYYLWNLEALCE